MRRAPLNAASLALPLALVALTGCGAALRSTSHPGARAPAPRASGSSSSSSSGAAGTDHYLGALDNGAPVCSGGLASDAFGFGLCLCGDAAFAGDLHVHGVDASTPGSAAANGRWSRAGTSTIDGDLVVGGGMSGAGNDHIEGNLDVGGDFTQAGTVDVGGDAHVGGNAVAAGVVTIDGSLTVPDGATVLGVDAQSLVRADVSVPPPCDCGDTADTHVDIAGLVAQARAQNDDAAAGIDPNGFTSAGDVDLTLADGNFFVEQIAHAGVVTLHVTGAAALFVGGDIASAGDIDVDLADGATLDLFVGGDIASAGVLHLGSADRADAVRVYIDGSRGLTVAGNETFAGALYLPHGTLASAGNLDVAGAVVARDLAAAGRIDIGFASGLVDGGNQSCTPPGAGGGDNGGDTGANGGDTGANGGDAGANGGDTGANGGGDTGNGGGELPPSG